MYDILDKRLKFPKFVKKIGFAGLFNIAKIFKFVFTFHLFHALNLIKTTIL